MSPVQIVSLKEALLYAQTYTENCFWFIGGDNYLPPLLDVTILTVSKITFKVVLSFTNNECRSKEKKYWFWIRLQGSYRSVYSEFDRATCVTNSRQHTAVHISKISQ